MPRAQKENTRWCDLRDDILGPLKEKAAEEQDADDDQDCDDYDFDQRHRDTSDARSLVKRESACQ